MLTDTVVAMLVVHVDDIKIAATEDVRDFEPRRRRFITVLGL